MCNIGATIAGTGVSSYGQYFQMGRNKPFTSGTPNQSTLISASVGLNASTDTAPFIIPSSGSNWATDTSNDNNWSLASNQ
jgi:hypothetical protein